MKTFENLTIKQVKKEIIAWETSMGTEAKTVEVVNIGQDPDDDMYEQGDGHICEQFYAELIIDDEPVKRCYEWDTEEESIICDMGSDDGDKDEDRLPQNVVARLGYAGQALDTLDLNPLPEVDVNRELPYAVTCIRMAYPFEIEGNGQYNVYEIAPAKTWGELLTETIKVFQREYEAGKANSAPHTLSDYVIERIDIHPGDLATICIGS